MRENNFVVDEFFHFCDNILYISRLVICNFFKLFNISFPIVNF